jgi:sugar lactone lactonase YvrE
MNQPVSVTPPAALAEGPLWDAARQALLWVDIPAGEVHRYDPVTGSDSAVSVGVPVGAVAVRQAGGLVLAAGLGFAVLDEASGLSWLWTDGRGDRMNDGKCDPAGRFLAGTMSAQSAGAALDRLDGGRVHTLLTEVTLSNGLGWSPAGDLLYYVDTRTERVDVFDYDLATGTLRDRRLFVDLRDAEGQPDGLTVDSDGAVWVAMAYGGAVRRHTADGRLDRIVALPANKVTNVAFGGAGLSDLYITTARDDLSPAELAEQPEAGCVFRLDDVGVRGLPAIAYAG